MQPLPFMHRLLSMFGAPHRVALSTIALFFGGMTFSLLLVGVAPLFAGEASAAEPTLVRAALTAPAPAPVSLKSHPAESIVAQERDEVALPLTAQAPMVVPPPSIVIRRQAAVIGPILTPAPPTNTSTSRIAMAISPPPRVSSSRHAKSEAAAPAAGADADLLSRASAETTATLGGH